MNIIDSCKVYFTGTPISDAPTATANPVEIISGRVVVHGLFSSYWLPLVGNAVVYARSRPYYLCGSENHEDIYFKFVPVSGMSPKSSNVFNYLMGGNGLLFPNGVFLGKDSLAPDGLIVATDTAATLTILYTGGANT